MDINNERLQLLELFYPYFAQRQREIKENGRRFVHYTSAEAALSIIDNKQVWMRNSSTMNDFLEIKYGIHCVSSSYNGKSGTELKSFLNDIYRDSGEELDKILNISTKSLSKNTYLTCLSEHIDDEDDIGRLSMWRAYGGATGVAIVLNNTPFLAPSDALNAYTNPVAYLSVAEFTRQFDDVVHSIISRRDLIEKIGRNAAINHIFRMLQFAALCTKHHGFREEKEWRVIYSPVTAKSQRLIHDVAIIRGTPQPIYKIPLTDVPDEDLVGVELPSLLERVIIGPTQYPDAVREAFVVRLEKAGVMDAAKKVHVSHIPLRT